MRADTPITLRTRVRVRLWLWRWWVERNLPRVYAGWRYFHGARSPYMGEDTCGTYVAPGVWVTFGGACPVQGTGEIDGFGCYFRSRRETWSLDVYDCEVVGNDLPDDEHHVWEYHRREYVGYAGGWIDHRESRRNLEIAVKRFREWRMARRMGAFEQADLARQYADWNETLVHAPPLIGLNVHVLPGAGWTS